MISIKNMRKIQPENPWDVVVSHPAPFGNPYVKKGGVVESERNLVCDKYEVWFNDNLDKLEKYLTILEEKHNEYGKLNLFCWCHPKRCHAETIKKYLDQRIEQFIDHMKGDE